MNPHVKLYHHESVSRGNDNECPIKSARAKGEANYMRLTWENELKDDPFYNPNLNYARPDFSLSHSPLVTHPWLVR
jgi:hypothetical protein